MKSVRSFSFSLKYQKFPMSGCKDIGIRKLGCVSQTQFQFVRNNLFITLNTALSNFQILAYKWLSGCKAIEKTKF